MHASPRYRRVRTPWSFLSAWLLLLTVSFGQPSAMASTPSPEAATAQAPMRLSTLMAAFRAMPGLEARFSEEKHLALLAVPLRSTGTMYYAPGGYLLRRVDGPNDASMVLTPRELRIEEGGKAQRFDLRARPDVAHFVQSFLWVLSGDEPALEQHFYVAFDAHANDGSWELTLKPKDRNMAHIVDAIRVRGQGLSVQEVRVDERSGDATVTRISDANPERRFSAAERATLFEGRAP